MAGVGKGIIASSTGLVRTPGFNIVPRVQRLGVINPYIDYSS